MRASYERRGICQVFAPGNRAGRKWSPEAYVNMDMRTTSHNTAIEAIKLRQQDYDADIFRVSRHSGARPLCYPYQGKYYTWGTGSGTFTDGDGRRHTYRSIYSTSYGKPAGLFGINCGHYPEPMIPGVSIPTEQDDKESKEENDRIYAESQEQRALERRVRYAKREAAMYEAAGDKEAFTKASQKVKNAQADYNAFCKKTGRKKRLDRTQVYGYNKSVSSKATAAVKQAETAKAEKLSVKPSSSKTIEKHPKTKLPDIQPQTREYRKFETGKDVNDFFYYDDEKRGLPAKKKSGYSKWLNGLDKTEHDYILDYTAGGYGDINDYFRKRGSWQEINADRVEEMSKSLDSAISKFELKESIFVQRGVMEDALDETIEKYNITDNSELIGKVFHDEGYVSTTVLLGNPVATTKPVLFEISVPAGTGRGAYVNELSGFTDAEYEFLLKRGADYTITDVEEDIEAGKTVVKMVMNVE